MHAPSPAARPPSMHLSILRWGLGWGRAGIAGGLVMYQGWGGTPSGRVRGSFYVPNQVWYIRYPPIRYIIKGGDSSPPAKRCMMYCVADLSK